MNGHEHVWKWKHYDNAYHCQCGAIQIPWAMVDGNCPRCQHGQQQRHNIYESMHCPYCGLHYGEATS